MPTFSKSSLDKLATCDRRLYDICSAAIMLTDFVVVCGHRDKAAQDKAVAEGKSKTPYPQSKHNKTPSEAVDLALYKNGGIDWNDRKGFEELANVILKVAGQQGVKLRWGGDFNRNGNLKDDKFVDLPHFEIDV